MRKVGSRLVSLIKTLIGQPNTQDWMAWFEDWIELLRAGIGTLESLGLTSSLLSEGRSHLKLREAIDTAHERLCAGEPLASAFNLPHNPVPNEILLALNCGQQTGDLATIAQRHLTHWKAKIQARKDLLKTMVYPSLVLGVALLSWWVLDTTTASNQQRLSVQAIETWAPEDILLAFGIAILLLALITARRRNSQNTDHAIVNLQLGWSPSSAWYVSQFFFGMEQELLAGHDLMHCLRHRPCTGRFLLFGHRKLHAQLNLMNARIYQNVRNGYSLPQALKAVGAPGFMQHQARLADETGQMERIYGIACKLFELQAKTRQRRIQAVLAPVTLLLAALTLVSAYYLSLAPLYASLGAY